MTAQRTHVRILQGLERPTRQQLDAEQDRINTLAEENNNNARELIRLQNILDEKYKQLEIREKGN